MSYNHRENRFADLEYISNNTYCVAEPSEVNVPGTALSRIFSSIVNRYVFGANLLFKFKNIQNDFLIL